MKINFHYQTPHDCATHLAVERLFNIYKKEYPDIEFTYYDYRFLYYLDPDPLNSLLSISDAGKPITELSKFRCFNAANGAVIIENEENRKYFLISYLDRLHQIKNPVFEVGGCVEVFACFGVHGNNITYGPDNIKYTPIGYVQSQKRMEIRSQELYKSNPPRIIPPKLHFRSHAVPYHFRSYLSLYDDRFDMRNGLISGEEHIEEMSKYLINIDINSMAEISHRTADAFALGTALIRPELTVQFHNKLIPNYHYAAVRPITPDLQVMEYYIELADAYIERFEELKKDPDYVHFISVNGRKWYEENATIEAHANILKEVIDLNKLL